MVHAILGLVFPDPHPPLGPTEFTQTTFWASTGNSFPAGVLTFELGTLPALLFLISFWTPFPNSFSSNNSQSSPRDLLLCHQLQPSHMPLPEPDDTTHLPRSTGPAKRSLLTIMTTIMVIHVQPKFTMPANGQSICLTLVWLFLPCYLLPTPHMNPRIP